MCHRVALARIIAPPHTQEISKKSNNCVADQLVETTTMGFNEWHFLRNPDGVSALEPCQADIFPA